MAARATVEETVEQSWYVGERCWVDHDGRGYASPVTIAELLEDGRARVIGAFGVELDVELADLSRPGDRPAAPVQIPAGLPPQPRPDPGALRVELATAIAAVGAARSAFTEAERILAKGQQHLGEMERAQHQVAALDRLSEDVLISVMRNGAAMAPRELLEQELSASDVATAVGVAVRICGRLAGEQEIARSEVARAERVVRQVAAKVVAAEAEDVGDRLAAAARALQAVQLEAAAIGMLWLPQGPDGKVALLPLSPELAATFERHAGDFPPGILTAAIKAHSRAWRRWCEMLRTDPAATLVDAKAAIEAEAAIEEAPAIAAE